MRVHSVCNGIELNYFVSSDAVAFLALANAGWSHEQIAAMLTAERAERTATQVSAFLSTVAQGAPETQQFKVDELVKVPVR